jgi:predicted transcriptional regulator
MNSDLRSFKRHIDPLLVEGLIEMTVPDKPNSKLQKYRLTGKGKKHI